MVPDANKAWLIQNNIGNPSTDAYINYVQINLIPNCPVTKTDILRAEDILGPNLGSLKGKTVRKTPEKVRIKSCDELPDSLLEGHGNVTLAIDIMYINLIPFMMTMSRAIHFGTAEMKKRKDDNHHDIPKNKSSIHTMLMGNMKVQESTLWQWA